MLLFVLGIAHRAPRAAIARLGSVGSLGRVGSLGSLARKPRLRSVGNVGSVGNEPRLRSVGGVGSAGSVGSLSRVGSLGRERASQPNALSDRILAPRRKHWPPFSGGCAPCTPANRDTALSRLTSIARRPAVHRGNT